MRQVPRLLSYATGFPMEGCCSTRRCIFFLMRPLDGALEDHDAEFDVVQWFPVEEACRTLSYQNEVEVVRRVVSMLLESGMKC